MVIEVKYSKPQDEFIDLEDWGHDEDTKLEDLTDEEIIEIRDGLIDQNKLNFTVHLYSEEDEL